MKNQIDIGNPVRTRAILEEYGLSAKKSLGQNFLTDPNVLINIAIAAGIDNEDDVIEVGPGIGALTEQLARRAHQVLAFEIDQNLLDVLDDTLAEYKNVTVLNQDVLKANLPNEISEYFDGKHHLKMVANLPYYITTPILKMFMASPLPIEKMVVMMQKEVADRLTAKPGTKEYGSLSVVVQYRMHTAVEFDVPAKVFVPKPKVDSAIVSLTPRDDWTIKPDDEIEFFKTVHGCFMHRRKNIWNNLQGLYGKDASIKETIQMVLDDLEISPQIRPERLTVEDFIRLANRLGKTDMKRK
ncbi:16S rRNA (adenine(1518)-N(6)/adenine(1519)-N(6))-dimethyltransferase RsmA [Pediococcus claussenii]|uniref:Ribosomal RNA small subunit methyltransferase A n=1 Tax=Pediococcus claussenii (strain ATCC BAA-344 / DSM 14800 / JCM 18046 / KCTC 3811 / LMG 21948 / P06) TaxID=701521 RepID=G8PEP2_PEDCP|nr:16S rRNA (adenine(1518)-N(6)/adenine(1519)-N(6))-dimethyltransferase RsmA [Pediococcus claussenii]AEV94422.1 dimethyladenosine transferase [Pediococcus claussenii ATCC BAA-344]ANZ69642.1 16S rRNA (adenine(1518)-N(6)/adenine(1519)-N(6))-dimethyltransferase [Pediococcus claussenii]ANZ71459.1 16S rRNA (adenine(1518)-N(6)/adenine(1519)-N(6))-dimethyltransferase [Pediococcus claussenii]KRN19874.1 ksgA protein [Pediococcus claussenii]